MSCQSGLLHCWYLILVAKKDLKHCEESKKRVDNRSTSRKNNSKIVQKNIWVLRCTIDTSFDNVSITPWSTYIHTHIHMFYGTLIKLVESSVLWNLLFGLSTAISSEKICWCCHPKANYVCSHIDISVSAYVGLTFGSCTYSCVIFTKVLYYFLQYSTIKWLQTEKIQ